VMVKKTNFRMGGKKGKIGATNERRIYENTEND